MALQRPSLEEAFTLLTETDGVVGCRPGRPAVTPSPCWPGQVRDDHDTDCHLNGWRGAIPGNPACDLDRPSEPGDRRHPHGDYAVRPARARICKHIAFRSRFWRLVELRETLPALCHKYWRTFPNCHSS